MAIDYPTNKKVKKQAGLYADALGLTGLRREACIQDLTAGANWMRSQIEKQLR